MSKKTSKKSSLNLTQREVKTLTSAVKSIKRQLGNDKGRFFTNGLESLVSNFMGSNPWAPQINKTTTIDLNLRMQPLTFERPTLNFLYMEYGIIRTAIDMPVDDALRGGVKFSSNQISADQVKELQDFMFENGVYDIIKTTTKWGRLFGGAGIIINNGQDFSKPLDLEKMGKDDPLEFYDADRWELQMPNKEDKRPDSFGYYPGDVFYYYGKAIHRSRVATLKGDSAPSLIRRMFMGWGLSEVEKMVRDLNQYIKALNVIFELLDEAKIDVYKLEGYKSSLIRPSGEAKTRKAIGLTNSLKSHINALVLDKNDEWDQKQLSFSGLAEMVSQIRIGMASTVRIPVTKLFGISASGFNSGEDDIANYNSMIESDIRSRIKYPILLLAKVVCKKLFGMIPDLSFEYFPLPIMNQNEEEDMKSKKQMRILNNYDRGLTTAKETMEAQRSEGLLSIDKTASEEGLTEDFPIRPVDKVTMTQKTEEENPAEAKKSGNGEFFKKDDLRE